MNLAPEHLRNFEWYLPHQAWLAQQNYSGRHDPEGADFRRAGLRFANLVGADLRGADLHGVRLRDADLRYANFYSADLSGADLSRVRFHQTVFTGCDLSEAKLSENLIKYLAESYPAEYMQYALGL